MIYTFLMLFISLVLFFITFLSNIHFKTKEKLFSFECGFNPFLSPRTPFSIQFFKIILIFLLFDIEIILVLPLPLFHFLSFHFLIFCMLILFILILGLYFEWMEGSLNWFH